MMPAYSTTTLLLLILDMALVIWGQQTFPPNIVTFPPPPTMTTVINSSLVLFVGEDIVVGEDVRVTIDCSEVIDRVIAGGIPNPTIRWIKDGAELVGNGSAPNVDISADRRQLIITDTLLPVGGQTGNCGNYACEVCEDASDLNCRNETTCNAVCGYPNIMTPAIDPIVSPTFISMGCGQDVTVDSLATVSSLIINCMPFNGSEPFVQEVYKDGELIQNDTSFGLFFAPPSDDNFGTYTFALSTEKCGTATAVSRIIRQADPPDIDEGPFVPRPPTVMPGDMTVTIGTPTYIVDGFNVTLVCNITSGTRPITIMWLHNGVPFPAGGSQSVITIPATDYNDGDVFTCRADNIIGFNVENTTINVFAVEEDCSVTMVNGKVNHNRRRNRTRLRFSSDGDPEVTYRCKLDDEMFDDCKSPMTWRSLKRGKHTVIVNASCVDDEGNLFSTVSRNFKFRVR